MDKYYNTKSAVKSSSLFRHRRPPFMEPGVVVGVGVGIPPSHDGYVRHLRRSSSFPLRDDAGYIGYLTDDDERLDGSGDDIMSVVDRRRRELLGPDISFSMCCLLMVMVMMVMVIIMIMWGSAP